MDFRKVFDTIPEEFDKWRPRYCDALFADLVQYVQLSPEKAVLEIGPGTGQATEPILKTGCQYTAIELGEHLTQFMINKFDRYKNFHIVNADFETYDFEGSTFDLVYSAAAIQWIPEQIGFPKVYKILKHGGTFAMMLTRSEYKSTNEDLYNKIQEVYTEYFHPEQNYTCSLAYQNVGNYGFTGFEVREYHQKREFTADEYAAFSATHCDHIVLREPYRSRFFDGIRKAVLDAGNKIVFNDTIVLYLARKD